MRLCGGATDPGARSPAQLRHVLVRQGVPLRVATEILGHSQISVTANTYTHVSSGLQREAMGRIHDLFGGPVDVNVVVNPDSDPEEQVSGDE